MHFSDCFRLWVLTTASASALECGYLSDVLAKQLYKKKQSISGQCWYGSYCHYFVLPSFKFYCAFIAILVVAVEWQQSNTYLGKLPAIAHHLPQMENELIFLFILLSNSYKLIIFIIISSYPYYIPSFRIFLLAFHLVILPLAWSIIESLFPDLVC